MRSVRLTVGGRVQRVGYRAFVINAARRLGLRGWVRNRSDGTVEALAIGGEAAIAQLIAACRLGPPAARVTTVSVDEAGDDGSSGFTALPTL
jgi:acylphosphatase